MSKSLQERLNSLEKKYRSLCCKVDNLPAPIDPCPLVFDYVEGSVGPTSLGPEVSFFKATDEDFTEVKDIIIPGELELTRGNIRGLFNIALEGSYSTSTNTPMNTLWSSQYTNPTYTTIEPLFNISGRIFQTWRDAMANANPPNALNIPIVMKWDNGTDMPRYWVFTFTNWGIGENDENSVGYDRQEIFVGYDVIQPGSTSTLTPNVIDVVSPGVKLTRKYTGGILYNTVSETGPDNDISPLNTRWNSSFTDTRVGYSGFEDLNNLDLRTYDTFKNALDGAVGSNLPGTNLIMQDLTTGIYHKVEFSNWQPGCYEISKPGGPTDWTTITTGSGYPEGTTYIAPTGGSGSNAFFGVFITGGTLTSLFITGGQNYQIGDILTFNHPGITAPIVIEVTEVCEMGGFAYKRTPIPVSCGIQFADGTTLNSASILPYKVYTVLLTQNGGDVPNTGFGDETFYKGVTYTITANPDNVDISSIGAPNNNVGTSFVANRDAVGEFPINLTVSYNRGAPVVTVLENTIGNIWFTYDGVGNYNINSNGLFTENKSYYSITLNSGPIGGNLSNFILLYSNEERIRIITKDDLQTWDNYLFNTPIEIRVYN